MEQPPFYSSSIFKLGNRILLPAVIAAILSGWLIATRGVEIAFLLIILPIAVVLIGYVFYNPKAGFVFFIIYSFFVPVLGRGIQGVQFGLGQDATLLLTWLAVIFHRSNKFRFRHLNTDLVWVAVVWFIITVVQIGNPEKPSIEGWFYEMRSTTLYWILSVPLAVLLFNRKKDIDLFLNIIIIISFLGALYGMKQLFLGTNDMENRWLEAGNKRTHVLFGKLRVFSFYTEAAQFGASQAQLSIMCIILAIGGYAMKKKLWYLFAGLIIFYGMIMSGTRGAMFALIGGAFTFLVLSKQLRILILGGALAMSFIGMLKFTSIGSGSAQIIRMRSSLDPQDASFQARLINQKTLKDFLSSRPFGTGVGTIGMWGIKFNRAKFISTVPPDSYYVKVWAMYGIVGFIIWFGIMLYITGKSAGIIWKTRDPILRNKLISLCAGATGILLCSYGNEVMNQMPSSIIIYVSWAFIWLSPRWDTPAVKQSPVA